MCQAVCAESSSDSKSRAKNIGGIAPLILTQVTLLHEALRVLKLRLLICGGKDQ